MIRTLGNTTALKPEDAPLWIDVTGPRKAELVELAEKYKLHRTSLKDCLDPLHLPKFETVGGTDFLILRYADESAVSRSHADTIRELTRKVAIFLLPFGIITVHRAESPFIDQIFESWKTRPFENKEHLLHLLNHLIKGAIRTYEPALLKAEDQFEAFESSLFNQRSKTAHLEQLYFLKRKAAVYKRMLRACLDAVTRFDNPAFRTGPYYQDLREEWERQFFHADELVEDTNHLMQTQLSLSSHRTNEVMRVLTLFSAFFLPLTFIVGIYGMNFVHMPEIPWRYGYPTVMISMALITLGIWVWFRRKRWL